MHKSCLQRWIDEKQHGNSSVEVACPQCNNSYIILYPNSGLFVRILDTLDRIICKACPFLAGGILVGSVYWTAVTYGAVTIMQVLGHKEGLNVMEKADPLIMLIGLPAIPVMLMLGRLIRWEEAVLKFWRKHSTKLPILSLLFPTTNSGDFLPRMPAVAYPSNSDPVSFTRTICGGLVLPTISTIFGKLLFQRINSNFQRSIIGGIAFIGLKGIFKIYYKQQQFLRQAHRQIKNYSDSTSSSSTQTINYSAQANINTEARNRINRRYRQEFTGQAEQVATTSTGSAAKQSDSSFNEDDLNESESSDSMEHKSLEPVTPLSESSSTSSLNTTSNFSSREY